ncbi:MAG: hypothetical protein MPJ82_03990, partial [Alphaproteobacteria bacterium]|nr:hypothetical protein [Alphaproteobacteria bacterium]
MMATATVTATDDDNGGGSIGVRSLTLVSVSLIKGTDDEGSLALVGEAFRLLKSPLKRTAPADACGRCPQKIKIVSLIKGTDDGGGSIGVRPLALVGVGLRQSRRWLKRTAPADACGRCPQKIKIV